MRDEPVDPTEVIEQLKNHVMLLSEYYNNRHQEDADYVLHMMIEAVIDEEKSSDWNHQPSDIIQYLYTEMKITQRCNTPSCTHGTSFDEKNFLNRVIIENSVKESMIEYFNSVSESRVPTEDDIFCDECLRNTYLNKHSECVYMPKYLFIRPHYTELTNEGKGPVIDYEVILKENMRYQLISIIWRTGVTPTEGHYKSYCKRGKWYLLDDSRVINDPKLPQRLGCITLLVYERV